MPTKPTGDQSIVESTAQVTQTRRAKPKVLADFPQLGPEAASLHAKHRTRRASDQEVDANAEVTALYAHLATLDPSSATYNPPAYSMVPTPRGGLDALVLHLLGRRPNNAVEGATADERQAAVNAQLEYDSDAAKLKFILFRMNSDILRSDDRYVLGQLLRVPTEFI